MREGHDVASPRRVRSEDAVEAHQRMTRWWDQGAESRQKLNRAHHAVRLVAARVLDSIGDAAIRVVTVSRKKTAPTRVEPDYEAVLTDVVGLVEAARHASARAVNSLITATYWSIGRRIVEQEQHGKARADYGAALVERLATDLTARFGRGFGRRNLFQMRAFFLAYREIVQTASAHFGAPWRLKNADRACTFHRSSRRGPSFAATVVALRASLNGAQH